MSKSVIAITSGGESEHRVPSHVYLLYCGKALSYFIRWRPVLDTLIRDAHMKAAVYRRYGPPVEVVHVEDVEKPVPKDNEVLLEVSAASVNPLDGGLMKGRPYIARLMTGLRKPKITRIGVDVAGKVKAIGNNVTKFKSGDEVFGLSINDAQASGFKVWVWQVWENSGDPVHFWSHESSKMRGLNPVAPGAISCSFAALP